jgi:hypothetical protein
MKTPLRLLPPCFAIAIVLAVAADAEVKPPWNTATPPADKPAAVEKPAPPPPTDDGPPALVKSPDGKSVVRIVDRAMPGTSGGTDFFTLEISHNGKVVAQVATEGYLISAHWNADGSKVAVNNRRGNSGDYLWVFSLPDGIVLKKADDKTGEAWLAAGGKALKDTGQGGEIYKSWLNATGWSAAGDLEINARMRLSGGAGFDFTAPASYKNGKWILTAGKVKAVPED